MNESKQAMLEAVANLRKQVSKDTIQVGVLLQELDAFEAALRASAPQEDGRAVREALEKCQKILQVLVSPGRAPSSINLFAQTFEAECAARAALSAPPSVALEAGREEIARIIDPTAKFNDIEGVLWSRFELQRRELAYQKADAILALTRPQPGGAVAGTERGGIE